MIRALLITALMAGLGSAATAQDQAVPGQDRTVPGQAVSGSGAVLRGLDKVSGQTVDVELRSGGAGAVFGLDVALSDCRYPSDNPTGDAYAYLTIRDHGETEVLFQGWMVASSPALNALDHNRYDIWVLRCISS